MRGGVVFLDEMMQLAKYVKFREEKFGGVLFETRSENQRGERVCTGTWINIVRAAA